MEYSPLRRARLKAALPIEVVARRARTSPRTVWLWERWSIPPRRSVAERIAQVLGTTLDELEYVEPEL